MRLVGKYTLVLVAALTIVLSLITYFGVERDRGHYVDDMRVDHRVVGHVLQRNAADLWQAGAASAAEQRMHHLIERANEGGSPTHFEWNAGSAPPAETQEIEGGDFVSRFPVASGSAVVGEVVVRESLAETERQVHRGVVEGVASVVIVITLSLAASLLFGRWLVGRPIRVLVDKARRVGRREFTGEVDLKHAAELGELAVEMNAMSDELARALARIAVESEALRHADRLSTVGRLAAGVAHELGTPLSIVGGHAQMIAGGEVTDGAVADSARVIDREATRMSRIVRQMLDFARRKGPEGTDCDAGSIAARCLEMLAPMAAKAGVAAECVVPAEPVRALIDDASLHQVLTNLAVNALHAGGALTITVARAQATPPDALEGPPRACVRIDVADTGPGIDAAALPHVFEPFFTTKSPGEGTGLGLAVVYGIVVDHGGWVTVESSPRGTVFSVFLQEPAK